MNYDIDYKVGIWRTKFLRLRGLGKYGELLSELCRRCLYESRKYNDSNEVAICYNINTNEILTYYGSSDEVDVDADEIEQMSGGQQIVIIAHNHPNNSEFSNEDIESFIDMDELVCLIAIGNTKNVYLLYKTDLYNKMKASNTLNKAKHDVSRHGGYVDRKSVV